MSTSYSKLPFGFELLIDLNWILDVVASISGFLFEFPLRENLILRDLSLLGTA